MQRITEIDFLRGIAILMMVFFHFLWNLNYFGFTALELYTGFWGLFQKTTAFIFLFLVGISLAISFNRNKNGFEKRFFLRGTKVFVYGLVLTLFSLMFFPFEPILFGVLHLIGASIFFSIPFIQKKYFNLFFGAAIIVLPLFFDFSSLGNDFFFWAGLSASQPALDFFPLIPWFGVVLIGIFSGNTLYPNAKPVFELSQPAKKFTVAIEFLGKHSLLIYFVHQMVLFPIVWAARILMRF